MANRTVDPDVGVGVSRPPTTALVASAALVTLGVVPGVVLSGLVTGRATVVAASAGALTAALMTALTAVAASRHRRRGALSVGAAGVAVAAVVFGALAAWRPAADAGRSVPAAVVDALVHGWAALATSPVPADASPRTLVPVAAVAALVTAAALALARGRHPTAPLLPGAVALVLAVVAAGRQGAVPVPAGLGFAGAAAAFLAARQASTTPSATPAATPSTRAVRLLAGPPVAVALAAALVATLVGPVLTLGRDERAFDPRDHVTPPAVPTVATSPLDLATGRRRQPDRPLFTVTADSPLTTRLVALDAFDGARWTTSATYRPTGSVVTLTERRAVPVDAVRAAVTITELTGPWLPSFGEPTRVTGVAALVDPASGSLVAADGESAGARYTVVADVVTPDLAALQSYPVAADAEAEAALRLPDGLPGALRQVADVAVAGGSTPLARALLLERYLRLRFAVDDTLATGQSYGHLVRALTETQTGTQEQYALAFAVLGRAAALPTRVAVGFGPGADAGDGRYVVRSGDARVWPEVKFDGVGWVAFDPVPTRAQTDDGRADALGGARPTATLPETAETARPVDGGDGIVIQPPLPGTGTDGTPWGRVAALMALTLAGLAVLTLGAATTVVVRKRRRTARRRAAVAVGDRVLGAWHDVLDRLVEQGVARPTLRTLDELVVDTEPVTASLAGLYRPVNRALYDDTSLTEADATQAWRARDRFVNAARRSATTRRRLRWTFDPRPLRRGHGARAAGPTRPHSVDDGGAGGRHEAEPAMAGQMEAGS